jgi:Uma2 family endonuclease
MTATITRSQPSTGRSLADLVEQLGGISLTRIRRSPAPGIATEEDLLLNNDIARDARCELIDGVLVEKAAMSHFEDLLATILVTELQLYVRRNRIAKVFTNGALYRLVQGNFRIPDVTVCLNDKFPSGRVERIPYADFAPDLAAEILSASNTDAEIERKRRELFASGMKLFRVIDPARRTVEVYTSADACHTLTESDILDGGDILPGFHLSIREWFREAEEV